MDLPLGCWLRPWTGCGSSCRCRRSTPPPGSSPRPGIVEHGEPKTNAGGNPLSLILLFLREDTEIIEHLGRARDGQPRHRDHRPFVSGEPPFMPFTLYVRVHLEESES